MEAAPKIAEKPAPKRIAVFLDGTWNMVGDNTNVWRMRALCADKSAGGGKQAIYYSPGLGTTWHERIRGGMFGYGLGDAVQKAYQWLVETYEPGDEIFIFGFSRGAFTARSLAGFVAMCGLLRPGSPLGVNQLYGRYRRRDDPRTVHNILEKPVGLSREERWMEKHSQPVSIKVVGVWDTVGALGVPIGNIPGVSRESFGFLNTGLRLQVQHAFHALAIDEHREVFEATLWTKRTRKDPNIITAPPRTLESVEQRWFVGEHANVGGGCQDDPLPQVPLRWMMSKASKHGLAFRNDVDIDDDAITSKISNSYEEFLGGCYKVLKRGRRFYRPIGGPPVLSPDYSDATVNETIDGSVFERWRRDPSYRPPNLRDWAKARDVDPATLQTAVGADDPTQPITT